MPLLVWSDTLSAKVDEIDAQHQHLLELLNQLYDALMQGKGREAVGKALGGLVDYTRAHFTYEERLMARHGYPSYAAHKAEHDGLMQRALTLQSQYSLGKTTLTLEVMRFLQDWLTTHIQTADRQLGSFLNGMGIK